MSKLATALAALALPTAAATAQPLPPGVPAPPPGGFVIRGNNTGGGASVLIPRGATGADTYISNSAVGSNVSRPELAVPNGSGGSSSGSSR